MDDEAEWKRWRWRKVGRVHPADPAVATDCDGSLYFYSYRYHSWESSAYERCIGLVWCGRCRTYSGAMVHEPRDRVLDDPLAALDADERDRIRRSETRLLSYLDRVVRRGLWRPARARPERA